MNEVLNLEEVLKNWHEFCGGQIHGLSEVPGILALEYEVAAVVGLAAVSYGFVRPS
jgi:hypothetical protein